MTRQLTLCSPCGEKPIVLEWPEDNSEQFSKLQIVETIKLVCDDVMELKEPVKKSLLRDYDPRDFKSMKNLCERFNHEICMIKKFRKSVSIINYNKKPSKELLQHILRLTYERSITDPKKLNQYKPFSREVYGETSFEVISALTEKVHFTEEDIFLDLGSGVGQIVLQISASTPCKQSLGIESSEIPCFYAKIMDYNFKQLMNWFGKDYGEYNLIKGDFLNPELRDMILEASIIFVNNYAFDPDMDYRLKTLLADLKDGSRIVSSRSLCSQNFRIQERTLNDIGCILTLSEMCCFSGAVSWTSKPVPYYLHVINRAKLQLYFEGLKDPKYKCIKKTVSRKRLHRAITLSQPCEKNDIKQEKQEFIFPDSSSFNDDLFYNPWNTTVTSNSQYSFQPLKNGIENQRSKMKLTLKLSLQSPMGAEPLVYVWPTVCKYGEEPDFVSEIIETIERVCEYIPELKRPVEKSILRHYDTNNYYSINDLCHKFNEEIEKCWRQNKFLTSKTFEIRESSKSLLMHILRQVYNKSVSDVHKLNNYKPFSSEVYGETSYEVIFNIINKFKLTNDDVFLDLGSGVGQVVLQVAASTTCKTVIGIERAKVASSFARNMDVNFKKYMNWYGKKFTDYNLIEGNFLDEKFRKTILSATVVFINNYAFDPVTDQKLCEIFSNMKDGTRIISSKPACPLNYRINQRNVDDVGSIMTVSEISNSLNAVSWTSKCVPFYLQVIDRTKLTHFLEKLQQL